MEPHAVCTCGKPLPSRHRKYCLEHAPLASLFWKREQRRRNAGTRYWLDHWLKRASDEFAGRAAYNAYMKNYMRRYRRQPRRTDENVGTEFAENFYGLQSTEVN
jgi:hypothetical protein